MNEALACGRWTYVTLLFHVRINVHSKKKYKLASIAAQIAQRSCGNNRFRERSPGLKAKFKRAKKLEMSAFLGSLTYALLREVRRSSISDWYVVSRAHKLLCFAQIARFCVHKQTSNRHTNHSTPCASRARGNDIITQCQYTVAKCSRYTVNLFPIYPNTNIH